MKVKIDLSSPVESILAAIQIFPTDDLDWETLSTLQDRFAEGTVSVCLAITHQKELTIYVHKKDTA